MNYKIYF